MREVIRAFLGIFDPKIGFYDEKNLTYVPWYPELLSHHLKNGSYYDVDKHARSDENP